MNNIIIFGGTGFIGRSLVKKISNRKNKLKIMTHLN